jgi:hypothetical protein
MGYWGYGPFDSDGAADLVAGLMRPVERVLKGGRDAEAYYGEARAAIELMLCAFGTDILGGPNLGLAKEALDRMLADKAWIERFGDPMKMKASLLRQQRRIADTVRRAVDRRSKTVQKLMSVAGTSQRAAQRRSKTVQKLVSAPRAAAKGTCAKPRRMTNWHVNAKGKIAKGRFSPAKP